jgi:hypothetical protein
MTKAQKVLERLTTLLREAEQEIPEEEVEEETSSMPTSGLATANTGGGTEMDKPMPTSRPTVTWARG